MRAFLMYRNRDFDLQQKLPWNEQDLVQDLELNTLFEAMALGDEFLFEVSRTAILSSLNEPDTILYRQGILKDCLKNPSIIREVYNVTAELFERKKRNYHYGFFTHSPGSLLYSAVEMLQTFMDFVKRLKKIADEHAGKFESEGFKAFFAMLQTELNDEYLAVIQDHLKELRFSDGILISAELGKGNEGTNYVLRRPNGKKKGWIERILSPRPPVYKFCIHERDESGFRALEDLRNRGLNLVANAVAQSADHIDGFFKMLRTELAFYVGCLNLYEQLQQRGKQVCFPMPVSAGERRHFFKGLYDPCLALTMDKRVIDNDGNADKEDLVIITGANQGGKSTFLRAIGLSQLMMQCGMFVPAATFCANICNGLFTHYKREEDAFMKSGKLDEELGRMSEIVDHLVPNSMLLFNESFAATNEREGSEIARQIVSALLEKGIKVFFVTHLYEFARGFADKKIENAIFLRAERQADGCRTFKLIEGEPLETSFGEDLYRQIFGIAG